MTMDDRNRELEALLRRARALYHEPPATPREEMWEALAARLARSPERAGEAAESTGTVDAPRVGREPHVAAAGRPVDGSAGAPADALDPVVRPRSPLRTLGRVGRGKRATGPRRLWWAAAAAAAAATLALGIGLGRSTMPGSGSGGGGGASPGVAEGPAPVGPAEEAEKLGYAAREHLGRTESLLTLVRADARDGRIDPAVGDWARGLLAETRMLMDARENAAPGVRRLFEDLELVLVQIAGVSEPGPAGAGRARTELDLALSGLEEAEVLSRLRAVTPLWLAGT